MPGLSRADAPKWRGLSPPGSRRSARQYRNWRRRARLAAGEGAQPIAARARTTAGHDWNISGSRRSAEGRGGYDRRAVATAAAPERFHPAPNCPRRSQRTQSGAGSCETHKPTALWSTQRIGFDWPVNAMQGVAVLAQASVVIQQKNVLRLREHHHEFKN